MYKRDRWKFYVPYTSRLNPERKPQEEFHLSPARVRAIIAGNRSGKTEAGAMECIWRSLGTHPYNPKWHTDTADCVPNHGWIIVPDWKNHAAQVTLPKMNLYLPQHRYQWYGDLSMWQDKRTGSTITVKTTESGRTKFQGADIDWAWEDEEIPNDIHREVRIRLTDRRGDLWITATPLLGLTWLMDDIYEPWKNNQVSPEEIACFNIHMRENPYLSEDEVDFLEREFEDDALAPARFEGRFVQLTGLVYPMFNARETHALSQDWKLPAGWRVFCAIDFGFTNPFVCLWFAIDGDGSLYLFHEYYKTETLISDHVRAIKSINEQYGCTPAYYVADPEEAQSRHEMSAQGITTIPADKKFMEGMNRVREYLKVRDNGKPMFYVHPRCKEFIWEMGRYVFKDRARQSQELNTHEIAEKKNDHGADALRYGVMSRPSPARMGRKRVPPGSYKDWERTLPTGRTGRIDPTV